MNTGNGSQVFLAQTHVHIYLKVAGKFDRHDVTAIFVAVSNQSSAEGCALFRPNTKLLFVYAAFSYLSTKGHWQSIF